jgi:hypothetical protein
VLALYPQRYTHHLPFCILTLPLRHGRRRRAPSRVAGAYSRSQTIFKVPFFARAKPIVDFPSHHPLFSPPSARRAAGSPLKEVYAHTRVRGPGAFDGSATIGLNHPTLTFPPSPRFPPLQASTLASIANRHAASEARRLELLEARKARASASYSALLRAQAERLGRRGGGPPGTDDDDDVESAAAAAAPAVPAAAPAPPAPPAPPTPTLPPQQPLRLHLNPSLTVFAADFGHLLPTPTATATATTPSALLHLASAAPPAPPFSRGADGSVLLAAPLAAGIASLAAAKATPAAPPSSARSGATGRSEPPPDLLARLLAKTPPRASGGAAASPPQPPPTPPDAVQAALDAANRKRQRALDARVASRRAHDAEVVSRITLHAEDARHEAVRERVAFNAHLREATTRRSLALEERLGPARTHAAHVEAVRSRVAAAKRLQLWARAEHVRRLGRRGTEGEGLREGARAGAGATAGKKAATMTATAAAAGSAAPSSSTASAAGASPVVLLQPGGRARIEHSPIRPAGDDVPSSSAVGARAKAARRAVGILATPAIQRALLAVYQAVAGTPVLDDGTVLLSGEVGTYGADGSDDDDDDDEEEARRRPAAAPAVRGCPYSSFEDCALSIQQRNILAATQALAGAVMRAYGLLEECGAAPSEGAAGASASATSSSGSTAASASASASLRPTVAKSPRTLLAALLIAYFPGEILTASPDAMADAAAAAAGVGGSSRTGSSAAAATAAAARTEPLVRAARRVLAALHVLATTCIADRGAVAASGVASARSARFGLGAAEDGGGAPVRGGGAASEPAWPDENLDTSPWVAPDLRSVLSSSAGSVAAASSSAAAGAATAALPYSSAQVLHALLTFHSTWVTYMDAFVAWKSGDGARMAQSLARPYRLLVVRSAELAAEAATRIGQGDAGLEQLRDGVAAQLAQIRAQLVSYLGAGGAERWEKDQRAGLDADRARDAALKNARAPPSVGGSSAAGTPATGTPAGTPARPTAAAAAAAAASPGPSSASPSSAAPSSSSSSSSPSPAGRGAASSPQMALFRQVMSNEVLAHEILVDPSFRLPEPPMPEDVGFSEDDLVEEVEEVEVGVGEGSEGPADLDLGTPAASATPTSRSAFVGTATSPPPPADAAAQALAGRISSGVTGLSSGMSPSLRPVESGMAMIRAAQSPQRTPARAPTASSSSSSSSSSSTTRVIRRVRYKGSLRFTGDAAQLRMSAAFWDAALRAAQAHADAQAEALLARARASAAGAVDGRDGAGDVPFDVATAVLAAAAAASGDSSGAEGRVGTGGGLGGGPSTSPASHPAVDLVVSGLESVRESLISLVPHRGDMHESIRAHIDVALFRKMLLAHAFSHADWVGLLRYIGGLIVDLEAPARHDETNAWLASAEEHVRRIAAFKAEAKADRGRAKMAAAAVSPTPGGLVTPERATASSAAAAPSATRTAALSRTPVLGPAIPSLLVASAAPVTLAGAAELAASADPAFPAPPRLRPEPPREPPMLDDALLSLLPRVLAWAHWKVAQVRIDVSNAHLSLLAPYLTAGGRGAEYERAKFEAALAKGEVTLNGSRRWLAKIVDEAAASASAAAASAAAAGAAGAGAGAGAPGGAGAGAAPASPSPALSSSSSALPPSPLPSASPAASAAGEGVRSALLTDAPISRLCLLRDGLLSLLTCEHPLTVVASTAARNPEGYVRVPAAGAAGAAAAAAAGPGSSAPAATVQLPFPETLQLDAARLTECQNLIQRSALVATLSALVQQAVVSAPALPPDAVLPPPPAPSSALAGAPPRVAETVLELQRHVYAWLGDDALRLPDLTAGLMASADRLARKAGKVPFLLPPTVVVGGGGGESSQSAAAAAAAVAGPSASSYAPASERVAAALSSAIARAVSYSHPVYATFSRRLQEVVRRRVTRALMDALPSQSAQGASTFGSASHPCWAPHLDAPGAPLPGPLALAVPAVGEADVDRVVGILTRLVRHSYAVFDQHYRALVAELRAAAAAASSSEEGDGAGQA